MTKILTPLDTRALDDYRFVELISPFIIISQVLREHGYQRQVIIPVGFVCDEESIPLLKGHCKRGGVPHDYLYRSNSIPIVPKYIADEVYFEIMKYVHKLKSSKIESKFKKCRYRMGAFTRRWVKYSAVKWFGKGSYHKFLVEATYPEIAG